MVVLVNTRYMIYWIIGIVLWAIIISILASVGDWSKQKIDFDKSYAELNLPLISLKNNNEDFNFLVDTGSNLCLIDLNVVKDLKHEKLRGSGTIFGLEGEVKETSYTKITLEKDNMSFINKFQLVDLKIPFGQVEKDYGVRIHGVLGNDFLTKYGCNINFEDFNIKYKK